MRSSGRVALERRLHLAVRHLEGDAGRQRLPQLALRSLDVDGALGDGTVTPFGIGMGFFPIRDMSNPSRRWLRLSLSLAGLVGSEPDRAQTCRLQPQPTASVPYHTLQSTSPPTPALAASRPLMTPREVVRMLVPSPPSTRGTSSRPKYTRRPGRLMRSMPEMTRSPCGPYFRKMRIRLARRAALHDRLLHELEAVDVALVLEDAGDLGLQSRGRHVDARVLRVHRVPDAREHVCNRVGHISLNLLCAAFPVRGADRCPRPAPAAARALAASVLLPAALRHARDVALERQLAEAEPAEVELPHVGARPAAAGGSGCAAGS